MLITNKKISNKQEAIEVIKAYSNRRLIEETYKYIKQEYNFEYMNLRDTEKDLQIIRMNNLYNLLLVAIWLSMSILSKMWDNFIEYIVKLRAIDYAWYKIKNMIWWWIDIFSHILKKWNFLQNRMQRYCLKYQQKTLFCIY